MQDTLREEIDAQLRIMEGKNIEKLMTVRQRLIKPLKYYGHTLGSVASKESFAQYLNQVCVDVGINRGLYPELNDFENAIIAYIERG